MPFLGHKAIFIEPIYNIPPAEIIEDFIVISRREKSFTEL